MNVHTPLLANHYTCTGCLACIDVCNNKALYMQVEHDGHIYPKLNTEKCVGCLKCQRACPVISRYPYCESEFAHFYAAWSKNVELRKISASGGVFSAMAEYMLDNGGVVVGATLDGICDVHHILIENKKEITKLLGSKYTQSRTEGIYVKTLDSLNRGKTVLFSGTGCQIAGLLSFLGDKKYKGKLITVDLICGGVPSKLLISKFIENEPYTISHILSFRTKDKGWAPVNYEYNLKTIDNKGVVHDYRGCHDLISKGFGFECTNRWSCYNCQFVGLHRKSDFTIGDFWHIKRFKEQHFGGISVIISHNKEADDFLKNMRKYLELYSANEEEAIPHNYRIYSGKCNQGHTIERKIMPWAFRHLSYGMLKKIYAYDNPGIFYKIYFHLSRKFINYIYRIPHNEK